MTKPDENDGSGVTTEALVDAVVIAALTLPVEERVGFVMARVDRIRDVYAKRHAGDAEALSQALALARAVEERANLKLAEIEAGGIAKAS